MHLKGTVSLVFLWPEPFTFLNSFFYYSNPSGHVFANVLKFDEVFASAKNSSVRVKLGIVIYNVESSFNGTMESDSNVRMTQWSTKIIYVIM